MPMLTRLCNSTFPKVFPQGCPPQPTCGCSDPQAPPTWDYGFHRLVPLLESPPVSAGILAITFFFFIAFFSNVLLDHISFVTLGIFVTLGTFGLLALVVLILFIL
jgi:hypothetical protein